MRRRPRPTDLRRAARIFQVLAHPSRVQIACSLANGRTATQKELLEELGWPQSTMARHIAALRDRGLVLGERHGNEVHLRLSGAVTERLLDAVCEWVHPETGEQFHTRFDVTTEATS